MADYRAYIVGPGGQFINVHAFVAVDRSEATKVAITYVDRHPVEVWQGEEWVGTLTPAKRGGPIFRRQRMLRKPRT